METALTTEEKLRRVQRQFPRWVAIITRAVMDGCGPDSSMLIRNALYQYGESQGKMILAQQAVQKPERELGDIIEELRTFPTVMGFNPQDPEVVELTPTRALLRFHQCPYPVLWKTVGAPLDMCEIWGAWAHGFYRAFNPRLDFTVLTSRHRGDEYCQELWELK